MGWADLCAQVAIYAAASHVNGSSKMKHGVFRRNIACLDQSVVFQSAYIAEADRADVPATVTFDAPVKFRSPIGEPTGEVFFQNFSQWRSIRAQLFRLLQTHQEKVCDTRVVLPALPDRRFQL